MLFQSLLTKQRKSCFFLICFFMMVLTFVGTLYNEEKSFAVYHVFNKRILNLRNLDNNSATTVEQQTFTTLSITTMEPTTTTTEPTTTTTEPTTTTTEPTTTTTEPTTTTTKPTTTTTKPTTTAITSTTPKILNRPPLVVYNRVEKCGSTVMKWVAKAQQKKMHFTLLDISLPQLKHYGDSTTQAEMVLLMNSLPQNTLFIRHLHFLDFKKFNCKWPVYINVVRDPVERFISFYYYIRHGFAQGKGSIRKQWKRKLTKEEENMTLDECVEKDPLGCVNSSTPTLLAYFCGQEDKCREYSSTYPLQQAKKNVNEHYLAVGLTEELENTLKLFSALLPGYFKGASSLSFDKVSASSKTFNRPTIKNETRDSLREVLQYEIDFYQFIKERFYKQLSDLNITKSR